MIVSDQGVRKNLYQKVCHRSGFPAAAGFSLTFEPVVQIVAAFPDGWLSSGQISREGKSLGWFVQPSRQLTTIIASCSECDEEEVREGVHGERLSVPVFVHSLFWPPSLSASIFHIRHRTLLLCLITVFSRSDVVCTPFGLRCV